MLFLEGDVLKLKDPQYAQGWMRFRVAYADHWEITLNTADGGGYSILNQDAAAAVYEIAEPVQRYRVTLVPGDQISNPCLERVVHSILEVFPDSIVERLDNGQWIKIKGD